MNAKNKSSSNVNGHMLQGLFKWHIIRDGVLIIGVIISLSISGVAMVQTTKSHKISRIAVNKISDSYLQHLAKLEIDERTREESVKKFSKTLEQELKILATKQGGIVLLDEAVISGGVDLTPVLAKQVREKIHAEEK